MDPAQPDYENVVEMGSLLWTFVGYGTHGLMLGLQLLLAAFLAVSGVRGLRTRDRTSGGLRLVLAVALLLPALAVAPWPVSLIALIATLLVLLARRSDAKARRLRAVAIATTALVGAFALWERDDPLALGARVFFEMNRWRADEVAWQIENDRLSPKVGDLAPDFSLLDAAGDRATRLSDFRGKRPVALVFGSYT